MGYDDSLDVVGVHLVGGLLGCLAIGFFGTSFTTGAGDTAFTWGVKGLFYGGGAELLGKQALGAFSVLAYSFIVTAILGFLLDKTLGFRISRDEELEGIDLVEHAETAYEFDGVTGGGFGASLTPKKKVAVVADEEVMA